SSFAKLSLPSTCMPLSAGGLTSRTTSTPAAIVTMSPSSGTAPPDHVDGSDHSPPLTAERPCPCAPACSCAGAGPCAWAPALIAKQAGTSNEKRNERLLLRMEPDSPRVLG